MTHCALIFHNIKFYHYVSNFEQSLFFCYVVCPHIILPHFKVAFFSIREFLVEIFWVRKKWVAIPLFHHHTTVKICNEFRQDWDSNDHSFWIGKYLSTLIMDLNQMSCHILHAWESWLLGWANDRELNHVLVFFMLYWLKNLDYAQRARKFKKDQAKKKIVKSNHSNNFFVKLHFWQF